MCGAEIEQETSYGEELSGSDVMLKTSDEGLSEETVDTTTYETETYGDWSIDSSTATYEESSTVTESTQTCLINGGYDVPALTSVTFTFTLTSSTLYIPMNELLVMTTNRNHVVELDLQTTYENGIDSSDC
eukprot:UN32886